MINAKKLVEMARKGKNAAAKRSRKSSFLTTNEAEDNSGSCSTTSVADKGHFVVYTTDRRRFVIPLGYLKSTIFMELFKMSEDVFGLPSNGPITFPCDAVFLEYIVSMIQRNVSEDVEKAVLTSILMGQCSSSTFPHEELTNQKNILVHGL